MSDSVLGVLLAGGLSRRMGGGDKSLKAVGGETILARTIRIVRPQVTRLILNANGDPRRFSQFGLPVAADVVEGYAGPLAGILTGLDWAAAHAPECRWLLSVPTDCPFLPGDLARRLAAAAESEGADLASVSSGGQTHPPIGLWPIRLRADLRKAMIEEDMKKIDRWTARYKLALVDYPTDPVDPFFNANTEEDIAEAERLLAKIA